MDNKDRVLDHFEAISDAFDNVYDGEQDSALYRLVDILFRKSILEKRREIMTEASGEIKNKTVLDIGCGSGRYAIGLAKKSPQQVLGIDISPSMIALAQEMAVICGLDKVCKFQNIDFMDSNFLGSFDVILAAGVFDYVKEPRKFLLKIKDFLKGKAVLSFPIKWTVMTPVRMAWLAKRKCPNYYYSKRQIKKLFDSCGFKISSIYRIGSFFVPGNYVVICEGRRDK